MGVLISLLLFLNSELKPTIAKQFPINSQQQSLYGHSFGGLLVLYHFFKSQMHFSVTLLQALLSGLTKACYFSS